MSDLAERLETLAEQATAIAYDMQHEPDWAYVQHGRELLGAAGMMREWAFSINQKQQSPEATPGI